MRPKKELRPKEKSCGICQNPTKFFFVSKGYSINKCDICSFAEVTKQPSNNELEKIYSDLHLSHLKFRDEKAAKRENLSRLKILSHFIPTHSTVLDAGCSTGDFIVLAKQLFNVYGIDISDGAINEAKTRAPEIAHRIKNIALENISNEWPKFDAICLWDVIEHVRDPVAITQSLMHLLKPGGLIFLSTPDFGSITAKIMKQHWAFMIPPLHLSYFSRKSLEHLFGVRIKSQIISCKSRGKWTSIAFLFYKLNQINYLFAPTFFLNYISCSWFGRINLYVPTNDIIYLVVRKVR
jgi:2-polyprenyl-3-methyl-5-hydroxy-6-metoxy-1,4-benzoquinol methylase